MAGRRIDPSWFPLVVAHRGASATHPENTLEAFEAAVRAGAKMVEFDVRLTADGVPVILHDADVSRTTDGRGLVHQLTFEELRRFSAGRWQGRRLPVPSLREALELLSGRAGVDIEIKHLPGEPGYDPAREATLQATLAELDRVAFVGPVVITSFNPSTVRRSRQLAPDVPTGLLTTASLPADDALRLAAGARHDLLLPEVDAVLAAGPAFVERVHAAGLRLGTWTVDDPATIATLFGWGVDAVATNDPATALAAIG
ncbi:MAG TPA: glycerophosphodiester phosphodiesterase family protein [Actinomycetota bacterium]|nr:glycerophosphodiester phosphodiesterase family protein [Actinomycetota bacterium]